jgi:hypothetical protein
VVASVHMTATMQCGSSSSHVWGDMDLGPCPGCAFHATVPCCDMRRGEVISRDEGGSSLSARHAVPCSREIVLDPHVAVFRQLPVRPTRGGWSPHTRDRTADARLYGRADDLKIRRAPRSQSRYRSVPGFRPTSSQSVCARRKPLVGRSNLQHSA